MTSEYSRCLANDHNIQYRVTQNTTRVHKQRWWFVSVKLTMSQQSLTPSCFTPRQLLDRRTERHVMWLLGWQEVTWLMDVSRSKVVSGQGTWQRCHTLISPVCCIRPLPDWNRQRPWHWHPLLTSPQNNWLQMWQCCTEEKLYSDDGSSDRWRSVRPLDRDDDDDDDACCCCWSDPLTCDYNT